MGKRVVFGLAGVALVFGMKFFNKSSTAGEVKTHLVALCEGDAACKRAVDQHFESCFESSFKMGGRRRSSQLATGELVSCINRNSGEEYFTYQPDTK